MLYAWTEASSGKAKRIRRNGKIKITSSTASGEPVGNWVDAQATADASPEALEHLNKLMKKTFSVAKRTRTETGIGKGAVNISYAAQ